MFITHGKKPVEKLSRHFGIHCLFDSFARDLFVFFENQIGLTLASVSQNLHKGCFVSANFALT